jgi:hypothetical protein
MKEPMTLSEALNELEWALHEINPYALICLGVILGSMITAIVVIIGILKVDIP